VQGGHQSRDADLPIEVDLEIPRVTGRFRTPSSNRELTPIARAKNAIFQPEKLN
jgi:hypothetical protein